MSVILCPLPPVALSLSSGHDGVGEPTQPSVPLCMPLGSAFPILGCVRVVAIAKGPPNLPSSRHCIQTSLIQTRQAINGPSRPVYRGTLPTESSPSYSTLDLLTLPQIIPRLDRCPAQAKSRSHHLPGREKVPALDSSAIQVVPLTRSSFNVALRHRPCHGASELQRGRPLPKSDVAPTCVACKKHSSEISEIRVS